MASAGRSTPRHITAMTYIFPCDMICGYGCEATSAVSIAKRCCEERHVERLGNASTAINDRSKNVYFVWFYGADTNRHVSVAQCHAQRQPSRDPVCRLLMEALTCCS